MPAAKITVAVSPGDPRLATFTVDRSLAEGSVLCKSAEAAQGSPVFERLFALPHVTQVWVERDRIRVAMDDAPEWAVFAKEVGVAIRLALADKRPPVAAEKVIALSRDEATRAAREVINKEINPALAAHGGRAELVDVKDGVARVLMSGGCQGCGAAAMTLRMGIERTLLDRVPGLVGVEDLTDHNAGANPYYAGEAEGETPFN